MRQSGHIAISFAILVLAGTNLIQAGESRGYQTSTWIPFGVLLGIVGLVGWFWALRQAGDDGR